MAGPPLVRYIAFNFHFVLFYQTVGIETCMIESIGSKQKTINLKYSR